MDSPSPSDSAKALSCPSCGQSPGAPFRVGTVAKRPDLLHFALRCPDCRHEWEMDVLALDEALVALSSIDDRQRRVVELRFFAGLNIDEAA